jgi:two-component system phosphate regulon response regulator PhoB
VSQEAGLTHVLAVDDDPSVRELISAYLADYDIRVSAVSTEREMVAVLARESVDLVLLDLRLHGEDGMQIARTLRTRSKVPIIILTGRNEEADRVMGLELGADDYLTKPFSPRELLARINAVLRRSTPNGVDELIEFEGLVLDQGSHRVMVGQRTVALGPTEYRMLEFFMTHPERVYTRDQLLDRIWGGNVYVEERTIDVHIRRLRKALEDFGYDHFVQTVRGSGYRFSARTV